MSYRRGMLPDATTQPDLAALALFASVVELGSLGQAAAARGIAQPSASERIRRLERELGVALLVRSPRGSVPTPDGALVAAWAAPVLAAGTLFDRSVASLRDRDAGRLRVAASQTTAEYLLPAVLGRLTAAAAPELMVGNSTWVIEAVRDRRAGIGFIESPTLPRALRSSTVAHDEVIVVVAPSHRWAKRRKPTPLAELVATPLVMRERGSGTRDAFERAVGLAGFEPHPPRIELGSNAALRAALIGGMGPGVISRLAVEPELRTGALRVVTIDALVVRRPLRAVWLADDRLAPAAAELLAAFDQQPISPGVR